jgi:hypothetical protein
MDSSEIKRAIAFGEAEITRLNNRIHETVRFRGASPRQRDEWSTACAEFHSRYDQLAFPGGYKGVTKRILSGDAYSVEVAICFLELRPYFFRSGYMFKELLRKVKRAPMSAIQAERLQAVIARQAL